MYTKHNDCGFGFIIIYIMHFHRDHTAFTRNHKTLKDHLTGPYTVRHSLFIIITYSG